jgi:hypothetical protein
LKPYVGYERTAMNHKAMCHRSETSNKILYGLNLKRLYQS